MTQPRSTADAAAPLQALPMAEANITRPVPETEVCTGMDVPTSRWTEEDVAFWTGTPTYQPWKDVAAMFRGSRP